MSRLCVVCEHRPREVRLQCGHIFACSDCLRELPSCAICRQPISAGYYVQSVPTGPGAPTGGYVSSGSETYASVEWKHCSADGCDREATCRFNCPACVVAGDPTSSRPQSSCVLCALCANSWRCSACNRLGAETDFDGLGDILEPSEDSVASESSGGGPPAKRTRACSAPASHRMSDRSASTIPGTSLSASKESRKRSSEYAGNLENSLCENNPCTVWRSLCTVGSRADLLIGSRVDGNAIIDVPGNLV